MADAPSANGITDGKEKKNVIVNYLPADIAEVVLRDMFSSCGSVTGIRLMRDKNGVSLGYAFVNYNNEVDAATAIERFDGQHIGNKKIRVSYARPSSEEIKNANLYIAGLPKAITEDELKTWFGVYGSIISSKVLTSETGESRGVGFIRFDKRSEAQAAINALNGMSLLDDGTTLAVRFANPPKGSQTAQASSISLQNPLATNELRPALNQGGIGPIRHETPNHRFSPFGAPLIRNNGQLPQRPNDLFPLNSAFNPNSPTPDPQSCPCIFVYGLPQKDDDKELLNELLLYRLFSPHGAILSIHAKQGSAYGFVNMIKYDEAMKAVVNLNGYYLQQHNTHLQVSFKKNKPM